MKILYIIIYISLLGVPFWAAYKVRRSYKGPSGFCIVVVLSTVIISSSVITLWLGNDWYLDNEVENLDRNGDGFWSQSEAESWTPDEQETMDSYIGGWWAKCFFGNYFSRFLICILNRFGFILLVGCYPTLEA